jgi:aminopeptidase 2
MGLVYDSLALSKAGLSKLSSSLTLIDLWKHEKECQYSSWLAVLLIELNIFPCIDLVWGAIANSVEGLISTWWEYPEIVDKLNAFRRVSLKYAHI